MRRPMTTKKKKTLATTWRRKWRDRWLTANATSIEEMADALQKAADDLREMATAGVVLDPNSRGPWEDHVARGET
jgi:hypothetical protein